MKKTAMATLIIAIAIMFAACGTTTSDSYKELDHSYQVVELPSTELAPHEYLDSIKGITPENGIEPPYEEYKCIATMKFAYTDGDSAVWDVYAYVMDGLPGVWIVNNTGNSISMYGHYFNKIVENYNVHVCDSANAEKEISIYPEGDSLESYMIVS